MVTAELLVENVLIGWFPASSLAESETRSVPSLHPGVPRKLPPAAGKLYLYPVNPHLHLVLNRWLRPLSTFRHIKNSYLKHGEFSSILTTESKLGQLC
jgi:hypothetical protein